MSRPSLRAAIDAMCKNCIYDPGSGNGGWREQVHACSSSNCALHAVRPVPVKAAKASREAPQHASVPVTAEAFGSVLRGPKIGLNDDTVDERRAA